MGEYLNILVYGTPIYKSILEKIQSQDLKKLLNWRVTEMKDIKSDEEASNEIIKTVKSNFRNGREINAVLLFSDKLGVAKILLEEIQYAGLSKTDYPFFILASEEDFDLNEDRISKRISVRKAIYTKNDHRNVIKELAKAYAYINDLGDYFEVPTNVTSLNFLKIADNKVCLLDEKVRNRPCINFLFISKSCAEREILINKIIGEQKVIEGKTKRIQKYYHNKIPLCLINTPDLERREDYDRIRQYLWQNLGAVDEVFFVINSRSRTFSTQELDLLTEIRNMDISIFFPITKCSYRKEAMGYKSSIEIELQQIFGINCYDLLDHIQLLNLSDSEAKSLPIGYGLEQLKNIFIKDFDSPKQKLKEKEETLEENSKLLSSRNYILFYTLLFLGSSIPCLTNSVTCYFIASLIITSAAYGAIIYQVKNKIPPDVLKYVLFISLPIFYISFISYFFFKPELLFGIEAGLVSDALGWLALKSLLGNYENGNQRRWSSVEERINAIRELNQLREKKND